MAVLRVSRGLSEPIQALLAPTIPHSQLSGHGVGIFARPLVHSPDLEPFARSGGGLVRSHDFRSRCGSDDARENNYNKPEEREGSYTRPHTDTRR